MYRAIWRLHFYAGILCIPFILWLCITGTIYLFKPQVDALFDRPYAHLLEPNAPRLFPSIEAAAALNALPGSKLNAYQLPANPQAAAQVLLSKGKQLIRVYVDPRNARVLKIAPDEDQFENRIFHLHGELLLGNAGSMIVEIAASWAVVMIGTGLYLWVPRDGRGFLAMIWPRPRRGREHARELHGVAGTWVSLWALFMLISGLPWAASWGTMLKTAQNVVSHKALHHDWTTGSATALAQRQAENAADASMPGMEMDDGSGTAEKLGLAPLNVLVPRVAALDLPYPVLVSPPDAAKATWTARSDTQDRPLRVTLTLDPRTGAILARRGFADASIVDKIVEVGVASHEGQLFAPVNQALSVLGVALLFTVSISALRMWWSRRPPGVLGAPRAAPEPRYAAWFIAGTCALAILLPLFGASLLFVLTLERLVLRRIAPVREYLGLRVSS